jgi:hypothetical protein
VEDGVLLDVGDSVVELELELETGNVEVVVEDWLVVVPTDVDEVVGDVVPSDDVVEVVDVVDELVGMGMLELVEGMAVVVGIPVVVPLVMPICLFANSTAIFSASASC